MPNIPLRGSAIKSLMFLRNWIYLNLKISQFPFPLNWPGVPTLNHCYIWKSMNCFSPPPLICPPCLMSLLMSPPILRANHLISYLSLKIIFCLVVFIYGTLFRHTKSHTASFRTKPTTTTTCITHRNSITALGFLTLITLCLVNYMTISWELFGYPRTLSRTSHPFCCCT